MKSKIYSEAMAKRNGYNCCWILLDNTNLKADYLQKQICSSGRSGVKSSNYEKPEYRTSCNA